jgi:hypothetical protein
MVRILTEKPKLLLQGQPAKLVDCDRHTYKQACEPEPKFVKHINDKLRLPNTTHVNSY